ncbi:MAG: hypothetical protein AB4352_23725 [Hormoscilla sp.]
MTIELSVFSDTCYNSILRSPFSARCCHRGPWCLGRSHGVAGDRLCSQKPGFFYQISPFSPRFSQKPGFLPRPTNPIAI